MNPLAKNLAPMILEKVFAKYFKCYYDFKTLYPKKILENNYQKSMTLGEEILYHLTGFVCIRIPIIDPNDKEETVDKDHFKNEVKKYFDFKIRIAYPS